MSVSASESQCAAPPMPPPSPRPAHPLGARPTSELLGGSGMFQTPEGAPALPGQPRLTLSPAEALDQWFENLQNYEATLVRFFLLFLLRSPLRRKTWPLPPSMSTSKKSSVPSSSVSLSLSLFSMSPAHRLQGSRCSPRLSAPLPSTAFSSTQPRSRSASSSPSSSRWPGQTP